MVLCQQVPRALFVERIAEVIALPELGTKLARGFPVARSSDEFGDAFELHRGNHLHHPAQHVAPLRMARPLDQRPVDLDLVEANLAQIDQRGETGAEIVQRHPASGLAQHVDIAPGGSEIDQHGGLGDFQLQALGRVILLLDQGDDFARRVAAANMRCA